jgi:protein involved in polysaccharide export with SLBB domain
MAIWKDAGVVGWKGCGADRGSLAKIFILIMRILSLLVVLSFTTVAFGQATQPSPSSLPMPTIPQTSLDRTIVTPSPDAMIYDGSVEATEYRLGPGDVLQFRSWTSNDAMSVLISADNTLVIPRVGEFNIKGKTLAQAREEIHVQTGRLFRKATGKVDSAQNVFSLTLAQPRRIAVSVLGEVETPGIYTFTGATRADIAVKIADKTEERQAVIGDEVRQRELEKRKREQDRLRPYLGTSEEDISSKRYIRVQHADGTSDRLDLARFNATHDPRFAPLLREGDVVYVPFRKPLEGQIGVYGAVNGPSDFEYVEGDSLWAMIKAAFGPSASADLTKVELTRMSQDGELYSTTIIDAKAIQEGRAADVPLIAGDRIFVRDRPDLRELSRVILKGEVVRPGVYPIHRTNTKLSEVIKQAGGFTDYAFINGGTVTRRKLDIDNKDITAGEEAKLVGRVANLEVIDTANFRFQTEVRQGYVAVDMYSLFEKGNTSQDITLRDGDVVSIPPTPNTVYVWGYVGSVGHVPYRAGSNAKYYINAAGGYAEGAEEDGMRVIKARTRKWVEPDDAVVEPGDEIFVPQRGLYPDDYALRTTSLIVGILGAIASTVFTIILITRE